MGVNPINRLLVGLILLVIGFLLYIQGPNPEMYPISELLPLVGFFLAAGGFIVMLTGLLGIVRRGFEGVGGGGRGGIQGVVKSLRSEGGVANFWLEVSGQTGEHMPVEAYVGGGMFQEGDAVLVEGKKGSDGILRASKIHNLSRGAPTARGLPAVRKEMKRSGETEFSGKLIDYGFSAGEEKYVRKGGSIVREQMLVWKVERYDADGNPLDVIQARILQSNTVGAVSPGDSVNIKGKWTKEGIVDIKEATNITTRTTLTRKKSRAGGLVKIIVVLFVLFFILYFILPMMS